MESAGRSAVDGYRDRLASCEPASDHSITTGFQYSHTRAAPGYTPRALTYASQDSIDRVVMSVLGEELIRDPIRGHDQAIQASSRVTMTGHHFHKVRNCKGHRQ